MKNVLLAVLALGLSSTVALADLVVGQPAEREWSLCIDRESPITILNNAKIDYATSQDTWRLLVEGRKCGKATMPLLVKSIIAQAEVDTGEKKIIGTVVELEDGSGTILYAITAEPITP
jgi:hypothetical protein